MPSTYFSRTGSNQFVTSVNGNSTIRFDTNYGGAPLRWTYPIGGTATEITDPNAGTGFQFVIEQGQDVTQAGCNGVTVFPIARTGIDTGSALAYKNYYARESTDGFPTGNVSLDKYIVTGFFPDFWASLEAIDDSIPPNSSGAAQSGWVTHYTTPSDSSYPYNITTFGTPVYFSPYGSPEVTSGIFMEGNEQVATSAAWNSRLREIPEGRIAFRVKVSLSNASDDAFGGIMFRRNVPTGSGKTMDDVYNAQGYSLNVNRSGTIQLIYSNGSGGQTAFWTYNGTTATQNSVRNVYGIKLELRTFNYNPWLIEVWADEVLLTPSNYEIPSSYRYSAGKHVGLIAYTTNAQRRISGQPNFVRFGDREIFNVGTETTATFSPYSDGSLDFTVAHGPAPGLSGTVHVYTATQVAFFKFGNSYFNKALTAHLGTINNGPTTTTPIQYGVGTSGADIAYVGAYTPSSSDVGLTSKLTALNLSSYPPGFYYDPHVYIAPYGFNSSYAFNHINALPYINPPLSSSGWDLGAFSFNVRWYPFKP